MKPNLSRYLVKDVLGLHMLLNYEVNVFSISQFFLSSLNRLKEFVKRICHIDVLRIGFSRVFSLISLVKCLQRLLLRENFSALFSLNYVVKRKGVLFEEQEASLVAVVS